MLHRIQAYLFFIILIFGVKYSIQAVSELTSRNFDEFLSGGDSALIEFYSKDCGHCLRFEAIFNRLSIALAADNVRCGRVDASIYQAISSRFRVRNVPTLFLIRDGRSYKYDGALSYDNVISFAREKFKTMKSIPFWESPVGPVGRLKGYLARIGIEITKLQPTISGWLGVSSFTALVLIASFLTLMIFILTVIGIIISISHTKYE